VLDRENGIYKQKVLLTGIDEDCHMQHALKVERKKGG